MSKYIFVFDLDSTLTQKEILPEIAKHIGCYEQMQELTERTMSGELGFECSFRERVALLQSVPLNIVQDIVAEIPLNTMLIDFIHTHKGLCKIATGNLDVWIDKLLQKIDMKNDCFCSTTQYQGNSLIKVVSILDKAQVISTLKRPIVAIGDGANDEGMIAAADVGIGFGGVRPIAPCIRKCADYSIETEQELFELLMKLSAE